MIIAPPVQPPFPMLTTHFGGDECMVNKHGYVAPIPDAYWDNMAALAINILEPWRARLNGAINITRWYADEKLNRMQGGVDDSQHTKGQAADCDPVMNTRLAFEKLVRAEDGYLLDFDQAIFYPKRGFIHVSYRADGDNRRQTLFNPWSKDEAQHRAANHQRVYFSYDREWKDFFKEQK